jgi:hypothetical protein
VVPAVRWWAEAFDLDFLLLFELMLVFGVVALAVESYPRLEFCFWQISMSLAQLRDALCGQRFVVTDEIKKLCV